MITAGRGEDCIATPKSVLPRKVRREVRVAGIGQIAVRGTTNKATFALRIIPARGFAVGDNRGNGLAWCLFPLLRRTCIASSAARIPLVASSVVARVTIVCGALTGSLIIRLLALILSLLIAVLRGLSSRRISRPAAALLLL